MLFLVWEHTFTGTLFTALPPFLVGVFVMGALLKSSVSTFIKSIAVGVYGCTTLLLIWQFMP